MIPGDILPCTCHNLGITESYDARVIQVYLNENGYATGFKGEFIAGPLDGREIEVSLVDDGPDFDAGEPR